MDREKRAQLAGGLANGHTIEEVARFFKWDPATREEATVEAARMQDEADLTGERARLAEHMVGFEVDGEKYHVIARVELKAKTASTSSGNSNGKGRPGQLVRKSDGSVVGTYTAIAKACEAVGIKSKGQNGKALLAKLVKAGYTYQE